MLRTGVALILLGLLVAPFTWAVWGSGYRPDAGLLWSLENSMELVFSEDKYEEVPVEAGDQETSDVDTTQLDPVNRRLLRKYTSQARTQRVLVSPKKSIPLRHAVAVALLLIVAGIYLLASAMLVGRRGGAA